MIRHHVRVEPPYPRMDDSGEILAQVGMVAFGTLENVLGDQVAFGFLDRARAAGIRFPGKKRGASEEGAFLAVIEDHVAPSGRQSRNLHHA